MPQIERLHWGRVGNLERLDPTGSLFALWPEPIDADACFAAAGFTAFADSDPAWDRDLDRLIGAVLVALTGCAGAVGRIEPEERPVRSLVDRLLGSTPPQRSVEQRIRDVINFDSMPPLRVELGSPARAALVVSDGHPIFWIWLGAELGGHWLQLLDRIAAAPAVRTELQWERLLPTSLSQFA